jgi:hypothetical protein
MMAIQASRKRAPSGRMEATRAWGTTKGRRAPTLLIAGSGVEKELLVGHRGNPPGQDWLLSCGDPSGCNSGTFADGWGRSAIEGTRG